MNNTVTRLRRLPLLAGAMAVTALGAVTAPALAAGGANHAEAAIVDTTGETVGFAKFTEDGAGRLHVNVHVRGLTPGEHGIHLHAIGSCGLPGFATAGGHFNPFGRQHGLHNENGHHAGDLHNLVVNAAGIGRLSTVTDGATLSAGQASLFDLDGSAIVVHAGPDDHVTNPAGNSGPRVACGVIESR